MIPRPFIFGESRQHKPGKLDLYKISIHICNCVVIIPYSEFFKTPHTTQKALLPTSSKKLDERTVYELILVFAITVICVYIFVVHFHSENANFPYKNSPILLQHITTSVDPSALIIFLPPQIFCIHCTHSQ